MNDTPSEARTVRVQVVLTPSERGLVDARRKTIPLGTYIRDAALSNILPPPRRVRGMEFVSGRDLNVAAVQLAAAQMARGEESMSNEDMRRILLGLFGHDYDRFDNILIEERPCNSPRSLTT